MAKDNNIPREFNTKLFQTLKTPDSRDQAIAAILHIDEIILQTLQFEKLTDKIVNIVLEELGYLKLGYVMIVLSLIDKRRNVLERISISQTKEAQQALKESPIPFNKIEFSLNQKNNYCVKALINHRAYITSDLSNMLFPAIEREFVKNMQKKLGVKTSIVLPIYSQNEAIGTIIFSLKKQEKAISIFERQILVGFTNAIGIAVEHASLYRNLRKTNERLREVSSLKDEFVSLTSHELRTPLTAIGGSLATILDGYAGKLSGQTNEFLQAAFNENQRLIRLVNNLLNISRIEAKRLKYVFESFDFSDLVKEVVESFANQAKEKKLDLAFDTQPQVMIKADKDKTREILVNLIGNAVKYTDTGRVAVNLWIQDHLALVAVEDTGKGILVQDQQKLFQKFERAGHAKSTESKGGTGLGLYICKNILAGMNGDIWLQSEHGSGSTFFFSLPI